MPKTDKSNSNKGKAASVALPDYRGPMSEYGFYVAYWKDIESDSSWRSLTDIH